MVMTTLADDTSVVSIDMDRKYWLLIPNSGHPIMVAPSVSLSGVEALVKAELTGDKMPKGSYRILRHEGTIVKHKAGDGTEIPNKKTLFDLAKGDKFKSVAKYDIHNRKSEPEREYELQGSYWIRLNEKLGYLGYLDADGKPVSFHVTPDGRDETGAIAVVF